MRPIYEENEETLEISEEISSHISPHLHKSMELVSVTEGSLELGIGTELYHMEKGDFALVFPEMIHHYQVFDVNPCRAIYALASPCCELYKRITADVPGRSGHPFKEGPPGCQLCPAEHACLSGTFPGTCAPSVLHPDHPGKDHPSFFHDR